MKKGVREQEPSREYLGPIEIRFGDVFISSHGAHERYLITDVGADRLCSAGQVVNDDGNEALGLPGTQERKDIAAIIDHWDLTRILQATMRHFEDANSTGTLYSSLRENAKQAPRILPGS